MGIIVETYTTENGSNMDRIDYSCNMSVEEIAADLRETYNDWDYAIVELEDGSTEIVER
ncbi:hypothetical protein [Adlercreutzia mucosicola]|uniref:hypothetical protein n=1 Tax=Adlercreutzia mucosicola TaxID=580026 RepID=UPI0003F907D3|nr:hypothetical protein [Adlercreutzia mucosicola]MCR2035036.1 hypothetical protein [Adlercreutzia mucosicola]